MKDDIYIQHIRICEDVYIVFQFFRCSTDIVTISDSNTQLP